MPGKWTELHMPAYNAGIMNKGSRMTSGKTDIEKGMASPTNRQNRKSTLAGLYNERKKKSPYSARVEGILVVQIVFGRNGR